MSRLFKKSVAQFCAVCLLSAMLSGFVFAEEDGEVYIDEIESDVITTQSDITDLQSIEQSELTYIGVPILVDDSHECAGYLMEDTTYVSVAEFCDALGVSAKISWDPETSAAVVTAEGLTITVTAGYQYMTANDRCLYLKNGLYKQGELVMLPIRELARCFGAEVFWNADEKAVDVSVPPAAAEVPAMEGPAAEAPAEYFVSGEDFYDSDDLYWLSRIINAEAGNQSLEGMIGVGNVVLNRVENPNCPDTVYDVIFDTRYGVQFSPTVAGTIYHEPNAMSVIAAKICLEGSKLVGDSLYFVNPQIGVTSWFVRTRTYVATIGDHAFYA